MIKIYLARSMSGRIKEEIVDEARFERFFLEERGITVLCPVAAENVKASKKTLMASKKVMKNYWPRDKQMIEQSHVVFDMSPLMKSEGVAHELGYSRYFLYKPIVRVYPHGCLPAKSSVAFFEDDKLVDSLEQAVKYVYEVHGTLWKRLKWRFNLYVRCLPKMVRVWITSWK